MKSNKGKLQNLTETIRPRWTTFEGAHIYSGLSIGTLQNHAAAGHIVTANVIAEGNSRGRRLVDLWSLDAFIIQGVSRPPSDIAMNRNRKSKNAEVMV